MRPELERLQRIERHVLGEASPAEAATWATECLLDPDLQADAEVQRQLYQGLYLAGQRQLRHELDAIHARLYAPRRGQWLQAATAGLRTMLRRWSRLGR